MTPSVPPPAPGKFTASGRFAAVNAAVKSLWMVPPRVMLQRRASRTLLMHALRASARVLFLLAADATAFVLARAALNVLQTSHRLEPIDAATRWAVPPLGSAGGWQMGAALVVGLLVVGAYHSGDDWRSPRKIVSGVLLAVGLVLWRDLWLRGIAPVVVHYLTAVAGLGVALVGARQGLAGSSPGSSAFPSSARPPSACCWWETRSFRRAAGCASAWSTSACWT
ncbi:hypothetical protein ACN28S_45550 [Cystobacter fuscus]